MVEDFDRSLLLLKSRKVPESNLAYTAWDCKEESIASELLNDPEALRVIDANTVEDRKLCDYFQKEISTLRRRIPRES